MRFLDVSTALGGDGLRPLIPGLPDGVAILCLAKVSLGYRHALRAVCTRWRDVFNEKFFWDNRPSETVLLFGPPNNLECYDIVWHSLHQSTNVWTRLPPMPRDGIMQGRTTSAVVGEKLFVIGGWRRDVRYGRSDGQSKTVASSAVFYFDMKRYKWIRTASLNVARANCSAGVIKNRLYVCGGRTEHVQGWTGQEVWTSTAEVYDLTSETWTLIASMESPLAVEHATVIDEELYVPYNGRSRGMAKAIKYEARNDKWSDVLKGLSLNLRGAPVILNGKFFSKTDEKLRRSANGAVEHSMFISTYDAEKDSWEVFRSVVREELRALQGKELLIFKGKLCFVYRYPLRGGPHFAGMDFKSPGEIHYVIRDLENTDLAVSKLLVVGPEVDRMPFESEGPESIEYQIMDL